MCQEVPILEQAKGLAPTAILRASLYLLYHLARKGRM